MAKKSILLKFFILIVIAVSAFAGYLNMGQSASVDEKPVKIPPPIAIIPQGSPQSLEKDSIKISTAEGKTHSFIVELAKTREEQKIGMMYRMQSEPMTGMLFLFDNVKERSFWMKNTFIPLDIIFIQKDGFIAHIHENAEPHNLKGVKSGKPVAAVLEIAGGEASNLGINVGDRVSHSFFQVLEK